MVKINEEMTSTEFDTLLEQLEKDDDIENSILILQLIVENLENEITEEPTPENQAKKELKSKIDSVIDGFLARPAEFFVLDVPFDKYVEKETGFSLLPSDKKERSKKASEIIQQIAHIKAKKKKIDKEINIKQAKNKEELKEKIKKAKKLLEKEKMKEKVKNLDSPDELC